ncbi:MAG: hypothetical protein ACTSYA_13030 [Candidatus Kariarchaeaceae archaeon]
MKFEVNLTPMHTRTLSTTIPLSDFSTTQIIQPLRGLCRLLCKIIAKCVSHSQALFSKWDMCSVQ